MTDGNSYVVPPLPPASALVITSWSTSAGTGGGPLKMKVWRQVSGVTYMAVGHEGPRTLTGGVLNTFPASVPVKPGDVLGLNRGPVASACTFSVPGVGPLASMTDLADGESGAFSGVGGGFRVNISAVVAPSNAFTLGKAKLNKNKGTATLTVDVPNPGVLSASGNGVKTASAAGAVISKTVGVAGEVKLKIRAKGKKRKQLNENGKVKIKAKVTFTPTGGDPATQTKKLKLKKR